MEVTKAEEIRFQGIKLEKRDHRLVGEYKSEAGDRISRRQVEISIVESKSVKEAGAKPKFLRLVERLKEGGGDEITRTFDMGVKSENGVLRPYCFRWEGSDITHAVDMEKSVGKLLQNAAVSRWVETHLAESEKAKEAFRGLRQD